MDPVAAHQQASEVVAEQGNIIIEGPDGVAVTMSPDAAEETAHRLLRAVSKAREEDDSAPD
jgi:hypothetical protein